MAGKNSVADELEKIHEQGLHYSPIWVHVSRFW